MTHYRIDAPLGEGGMGVVYLATDVELKRRVAIKFAAGDGGGGTLAEEARAASRLDHPSIARIYELDRTAEGRPFFVMEYVTGLSLAAALREGPLAEERTRAVLRAVLEALKHAHGQGIVHRDIKPANIQMTEDGQVKVLDFGLASRVATAEQEMTGATVTMVGLTGDSIAGTPGYMSPEQAAGRPVDARSDLFSLGCVLYECLSGRRAFPAANLGEYFAVLHGREPDALPPTAMGRVAMRLLKKKPEERYQTADEVLAALGRVGGKEQPRQHWNWRWAAAGVVLVVAAVLGWMWSARSYEPKPGALVWYRQGLQAVRDGTYLKASKALAEAVRVDPEFTLARAHLAETWVEMDYTERAREEMLRVRRAPGRLAKVDRLHVDAIEFLITGEVKETIARYEEMAGEVEAGERASVFLDLARAYERAGEPKKARESAEKAVAADGQSAAAHLRLGLLLRRARQYEKAEAELETAGRLYGASSNLEGATEVKYARGMVALDRERPEEARRLLSEALESARVTGSAQQQVSVLLQQAALASQSGALDEVHRLATEAVELARAEGVENLAARALITLGGALFLREPAEAEKYYTTALVTAQRNRARLTEARAQLALGSLYSSMGQPERALAVLKPAAAFFTPGGYPADAFRASILLGRTQRDAGDYDGAERVFRALAGSGSKEEQALVHDALGQVLACRGRLRAAEREFAESGRLYEEAQSATGAAYAWLSRAGALWQLGESGTAAELLKQVEEAAAKSGNEDLSRLAALERAGMAVSQGRGGEALRVMGSVKSSKAARDRLQAAVRAASAMGAAGMRRCREALAEAESVRVHAARTAAYLDCALVAKAAGARDEARVWGAEAQKLAARGGQAEMEWRAWAAMGRGEEAARALGVLKGAWETGDFERYVKRPDVRALLATNQRVEAR